MPYIGCFCLRNNTRWLRYIFLNKNGNIIIRERIMWKWTTSCKSENLRPSRRIRYERSDLLFCFHHPAICRKPPHVYSVPLPSLFHRTSVQNIEIPFFSTSQLPIPQLRSSRRAPWLWCPTQLSPACQISCQIDLRLVAPRSLVPSPPCALGCRSWDDGERRLDN